MSLKNGAGRLVDPLLEKGCDRIFTVPGKSFLAVLDALHDTPTIDIVTCRQEGGVTFMACADDKLTGRPGPVVLALPEDRLCDLAEGTPRPRIERPSQDVRIEDVMAVQDRIAQVQRPVAIIDCWRAGA